MKVHRFKLSGGEAITLNDAQLYALHHMPAQYVSWPTYWALLFSIQLRDERIAALQRVHDLAQCFAEEAFPQEEES